MMEFTELYFKIKLIFGAVTFGAGAILVAWLLLSSIFGKGK